MLVALAEVGLAVTLFFIGAGLSAAVLRAVGAQSFVLGVVLRVVNSTVSLGAVLQAV